MRLQKYMAKCGVASRRKSEDLISRGLVDVNGKTIIEPGFIVDIDNDIVKVDGKTIKLEKSKVYIMLNKPIGYVTTLKDEKNRKVVIDLVEGVNERIYPIGRLDIDTSGLLILTNDGDLTQKLSHPRNEIVKRYIAVVEGVPNRNELQTIRNGINIDGKKTAPAIVKIAKRYENESILDIRIHEGRNRQVKKMCDAINHPVKKLKRVAIGEIEIGGLDIGNWRYLNQEEIDYLNRL